MRNTRFYVEFTDGRKRHPAGTVIAVNVETLAQRHDGNYDGVAAVFAFPNAPVASTAVGRDYLATRCKRVSEQRARAIHPALFSFLEME